MSCNMSRLVNVRTGVIAGSFFGVPVTFALEVLGAGGGIWANSEFLGLRNKDNDAEWGAVAITATAAALVRYIFAFYNYKNLNSEDEPKSAFDVFCHALVSPYEVTKEELLAHPKSAVIAAMFGVPITFILEVLGVGGATWGGSQYFDLRSNRNNFIWDCVAITVSAVAFIRYGAKYYTEKLDDTDIGRQSSWSAFVSPHKITKETFFDKPKSMISAAVGGLLLAFALEILGAGGALWGSSEFLHLRNDGNRAQWDEVAITFFAFGLIRYAAKYYYEASGLKGKRESFFDGLLHSMVSPHEAIKDKCLNYEESGETKLLINDLRYTV